MDSTLMTFSLMFAVASGASFVDLQFELRLKQVPFECTTLPDLAPECRLSYAVSVLQNLDGFDLSTAMLQEGHVSQVGKDRRHFREDTVVAIPSTVAQDQESHVFVGVKVYGVPKFSQDYFVIDVTKIIRRSTSKAVVSVDSDDLSFVAVVKHGKTMHYKLGNDEQSCVCRVRSCQCCAKVEETKIALNQTGCVNVTRNEDGGVTFKFLLNDQLVHNVTKKSVDSSQSVCFLATHLKDYANLCIRFNNLIVDSSRVDGCVRMDAELYHVRISHREMGCFGGRRQEPSLLPGGGGAIYDIYL